ncbi:MAG: hypothetical protein AAB421_05290 [Patescibacteria group bacterium]
MQVLTSERFLQELDAYPTETQERVFKRVEAFGDPTNHRHLRVHKLHGKMKDRYSFSVTYRLRIVFRYQGKGKSVAILLSIGDHSVYQ